MLSLLGAATSTYAAFAAGGIDAYTDSINAQPAARTPSTSLSGVLRHHDGVLTRDQREPLRRPLRDSLAWSSMQ